MGRHNIPLAHALSPGRDEGEIEGITLIESQLCYKMTMRDIETGRRHDVLQISPESVIATSCVSATQTTSIAE